MFNDTLKFLTGGFCNALFLFVVDGFGPVACHMEEVAKELLCDYISGRGYEVSIVLSHSRKVKTSSEYTLRHSGT